LNFAPIQRQVCGDCHSQTAAADDCVTCHNYHLGETQPIYLSATSGGTRNMQEADGETTEEDENEEEEE
jgi:hypothetical protein